MMSQQLESFRQTSWTLLQTLFSFRGPYDRGATPIRLSSSIPSMVRIRSWSPGPSAPPTPGTGGGRRAI